MKQFKKSYKTVRLYVEYGNFIAKILKKYFIGFNLFKIAYKKTVKFSIFQIHFFKNPLLSYHRVENFRHLPT